MAGFEDAMKGMPIYRRVIFAVVAANLVISVALVTSYLKERRLEARNRLAHQAAETKAAVDLIDEKLELLATLGNRLANELSAGEYGDLEARLKAIKDENPEVFGVGAAFEPFQFDPARRFYAPYCMKQPDGLSRVIHVDYDYTDGSEDSNWYTAQSKSRENLWQEPYFGKASETFLAEFTAPIIRDGKFAGVVYVNYATADIERLVATLDIGQSGYCIVVSQEDKLIFHPNEMFIQKPLGIGSHLGEYGPEGAGQIHDSLDSQSQGSIDVINIKTGQNQTVYHSEISKTGWKLLVVFTPRDSPESIDRRWHRLCWITIFVVFLLISLAFLFFFQRGPDEWDLSIAVTAVFVVSTGLMWHVVHGQPPAKLNGAEITSSTGLNQFKRNYRIASSKRKVEEPIYIPTGLFVQSIEFSTANDVAITGYVWQKFTPAQKAVIDEGVIFPESETTEITEAYRKDNGDAEVVGWYFNVSLRQRFDYDLFPLENNDVWIRIWHKNFDRNAVLVPDLAAYEMLLPEERPGVERDFVLPGWDVTQSYFSRRENSYGTDFGINGYVGKNDFPELYFNINIKRKITSPIIKHFVPLLVVLVTLFLMLSVSDRSLDEAYGFNSLAVIATATGLFFVAIFQHIDLRNSLTTSGIIYLEYMYFLTYAAILLVSFNSILRVMPENPVAHQSQRAPRGRVGAILFFPIGLGRATSKHFLRVLNASDGKVLKYLYWPLLAAAFWVITLWVYY